MKPILNMILILFKLIVSFVLTIPLLYIGQKMGVSTFISGSISTQLGILFFALWIMKFDFEYIKSLFKNKLDKKSRIRILLTALVLLSSNVVLSSILVTEKFTSDTTAAALADGNLFSLILFPVIIAPIVEELAFRAGLKKVMIENKGYSPWIFIMFSSIVFGALHWQPGPLGPTIIALVTVMGLIKSYIYLKTDNILITIGGHMVYNGAIMSSALIPILFMV